MLVQCPGLRSLVNLKKGKYKTYPKTQFIFNLFDQCLFVCWVIFVCFVCLVFVLFVCLFVWFF